MVYLLLAILCGSLFSIVFKLGQRHGADGQQVILFNYAVAFVFTLLPILAHVSFDTSVSFGNYVPGPSSWLLAVIQGALFTIGFTVMDRSTRRSGVALTTVCARASLILPVVLSWLLLGVFLVFGLSDFFLKVVQHTVEKGSAAIAFPF